MAGVREVVLSVVQVGHEGVVQANMKKELRGLSRIEGNWPLGKQSTRERTGKGLEQWDGRLAPLTFCNTAVT